jgi:hypothetical protein
MGAKNNRHFMLRDSLAQPFVGRRPAPPIAVHVEVDVTEVALDAEAWRRRSPLDPQEPPRQYV